MLRIIRPRTYEDRPMLIEHVTMRGDQHETRHEIRPDRSPVDTLSRRDRRKLDRAYRRAAKLRDKRGIW